MKPILFEVVAITAHEVAGGADGFSHRGEGGGHGNIRILILHRSEHPVM